MGSEIINFDGVFSGVDLTSTLQGLGRGVFFVQIGAMDGVRFDPIHPLVKELGWHGLMVEPVPDIFAKLRENYAGCENQIFSNMAIADYEGHITMTRVNPAAVQEGVVADGVIGLSTIMPDRGIIGSSTLAPQLREAIDKHMQTLDVPCCRLMILLKQHNIPKIDLLVVDTEGADWMVLRQLPLETYRPRIVYYEFTHLSPYEKAASVMHLRNHGYRLYIEDKTGENVLAVRSG
ncbi:MAG: FkbM family methyltransferase [Alphaproteobacteria bacterium]|nr:FkbM family methyltransferase [Alphaproteobacteria bacterium]